MLKRVIYAEWGEDGKEVITVDSNGYFRVFQENNECYLPWEPEYDSREEYLAAIRQWINEIEDDSSWESITSDTTNVSIDELLADMNIVYETEKYI